VADLAGPLAAFSCSLFAGAAVYINLVEYPARLSCGTELAAKRATVMQVSLAVVAMLAGMAEWLLGDPRSWEPYSSCL